MKKITLSLLAFAASLMVASAQAPAKFNYQGIARNASGAPLASKPLGMRITIRDAATGGTVLYQETQSVTTNAYGLYNVIIGNGTGTSGSITGINWASGNRFIQVEIDPNGGTSYVDLGASQLLSVPYAMYAGSSTAPTLSLTGNTLTAGGNSVTLPSAPTYTAGTGIGISGSNVISTNLAAGTGITVTGNTIAAQSTNAIWNANQLQGQAVSSTAPSSGQTLTWNGSAWTPATTAAYTAGTGISISSGVISVNSLGGDVTGAPNANTVTKIQGTSVSTTAPASGQVLKYNGTSYAPAADADAQTLSISGNSLSISGGNSVTLPTASYTAGTGLTLSGTTFNANNTSAIWNANQLQSTSVSNTAPSTGQALVYNGSAWAPATLAAGTVYTGGTGISISSGGVVSANNLAGDVTGAPNANTVSRIQGVNVSSTAPSTGQVLTYNGTNWAPAAPPSGSGSLSGTTNYVTKFTSSSTVGNSIIQDNGSAVAIGTAPGTAYKLEAAGGSTLSGIYGNTSASFGAGVTGSTSGTSAANSYGVWGFVSGTSPGTAGVFDGNTNGKALVTLGGQVGLGTNAPEAKVHINNTVDSFGLYVGSAYSGATNNYALVSENLSTNSTTANPTGVYASGLPSLSTSIGRGVYGLGGNVGVQGDCITSSSSSTATNAFGLYGRGYSNADALGVYGQANAYSTTGGTKYGIYGVGANGTTNYAGYFSGNVSITGSIAKGSGTFKIDHPLDPENKYLYHSFVESPDMMNIYNGNVTTDAKGYATVTMPSYFDALNKDFRYQLTVIGTFAQAIVKEEMSGNKFVIQTNQPNVKVSWQVTGVREDAYANAHRVQAEVEKEAENKGKYLHPVELGKQATKEINYELNHPKMFVEDNKAQEQVLHLKK